MADQVDVLDHGFVRLVDSMGSDLAIIQAARGSYGEAWRAGDDEGGDARLMHYLARHDHSTPFEVVELQFEVRLPVFVWRQWVRHRRFWTSLTLNELSGRYRELPDLFYVPDVEQVCEQSRASKQGRGAPMPRSQAEAVRDTVRLGNERAHDAYRRLLAQGVARELARTVLPLGTYTYMAAKCDLHNFLHFVSKRSAPDAQYEMRVYSDAMLEMARGVAPVAVAAWESTREKGVTRYE